MAHPPVRHAFTVDVEDWFHGIPIEPDRRSVLTPRLEHALDRLLDILAAHRTRGTFFVLGPVAKTHPALVRRIAGAGHEIGCHGWSHLPLYELGPSRFAEETAMAVDAIADCVGARVRAYRAAYFSITRRSLWAFETLASLGFEIDSSVFPVRNWRYGIPAFDPRPRLLETPSGSIFEFPISVRRLLGYTIAAGGGAYFRLYPYALTRANFRHAEREGRPVVFYLHPWELDPDHPRLGFHWRAWLTHYANLGSTEPKLRLLLRDFSFGTLGEVLRDEFARPRT